MTSAHLDYETLAELSEGLLDLDHAASADAHLADCAECRERSTEISEVSRLLAEASVPPMPAELATRIDAAIAAEMPPITDSLQARSRWHGRRFQILSAAAAAAVLVGGGITVTQAVLDGGQLAPDATTSASKPAWQDRADDPKVAREDKGAGESGGAAPSAQREPGPFTLMRSGTDYRRSTLPEQVQATVTTAKAITGPRGAVTSNRLMGCVIKVAQGKTPIVVDQAAFEGGIATLIVLPTDTPERLDAWLVGPGCSGVRSDVLEHRLLAG
jgi:hypothetical protein